MGFKKSLPFDLVLFHQKIQMNDVTRTDW